MAKQGYHKFERTFGCFVFYRVGDKYYIRQKSRLSKRRVKTSKRFANTMASAHRLGIASCLSASVYRELPEAWRLYELYRKLIGITIQLLKAGKTVTEIRPLLYQQLYYWGYRKEIEYPVIKPSIKFKVQGLRGKQQEARLKGQETRYKGQESRNKGQETRYKQQEVMGKQQEATLKEQDSRNTNKEIEYKSQDGKFRIQGTGLNFQKARLEKQGKRFENEGLRFKEQGITSNPSAFSHQYSYTTKRELMEDPEGIIQENWQFMNM